MDRLEWFQQRIGGMSADGKDIPRRGGVFRAWPVWEKGQLTGVKVSNLGKGKTSSVLSMKVFAVTLELLEERGRAGRARKGKAMGAKLGEPELALDSVEGRIANKVYDKNAGETVFRRITPVARLLEWTGICLNDEPGILRLAPWPPQDGEKAKADQ